MADTAARLAILARRNEVLRFTIAVIGIDLTGVTMNMQVRLAPGDPGVPKIQLGTVNTLAAEGLKLDGVTVADGVPTSLIKGRINQATMSDATKVPYAAEQGKDSVLAYAMQWTLNGDANTRIEGAFIVRDSAYGSDNAPANRPSSYGGSQSTGGSDTGSLTFGDQVIRVSIDGVDIVAPLTSRAEAAATRAEAANAAATTLAADIPVARDNGRAALTAALIFSDAPVAVPIAGDPNFLRATVPGAATGAEFSLLITEDITGDARLIADGLDRLMAKDGGGTPFAGGELRRGQIARFAYSAGGGKWLLQYPPRYASDRDPLAPLRPYLIENPWGAVRKFLSRGGGSSISVGQGGGGGDAPNDMFVALLNARRPQDGFQAVSQIVGQPGTGTLDMEAQFANAPASEFPERIRTYVPGMNDCYFRLFVMQHGFPNILAGLKRMLLADAAAGRISIVWTSPHPHPGRVNLADAMPADKPMTYPVYKAAPVTPADVRAQLGTDTVMRDWTGNGVITPGSRTFAQYNAAIEALCRSIPTAICIDAAWTFFRYGLEPAYQRGATAIDALYNGTDQNHFSPAGYNAGYRRATVPAVDAILSGDVGGRYFRGVPDGSMLSLPLLAQSELGSASANDGKIARVAITNGSAFVGAVNGVWRVFALPDPLGFYEFDFTRGMPAGAVITRAAGANSRRSETGVIAFNAGENVARLDYDPPVENRLTNSRVWQGTYVASATLTQTQDGEVTKYVQGAVPPGGYAFDYAIEAAIGTRTYSVDVRGEVGGEVIWILIQRGAGGSGTAYKRVVLTTSFQRLDLSSDNAQYLGQGVRRVGDTGADEPSAAQTYYVRRRQVNQGSLALAYIETTGAAIYTPAVCRGVMFEPERTNVAANSEALNLFPEMSGMQAITPNTETAPDGAKTADLLIALAGGGYLDPNSIAKDISLPWSASYFVRGGSAPWVHISMGSYSNSNRVAWFNLADASKGIIQPNLTDAAIQRVNSYLRISASTGPGGEQSKYSLLGISNTNGGVANALNGQSVSGWGAQLEAGAQPSSYIPTGSTAATRPGETLVLDVSKGGATGEVILTYSDGTSETRNGTIANGMLTLPALLPRVVAKVLAKRAV